MTRDWVIERLFVGDTNARGQGKLKNRVLYASDKQNGGGHFIKLTVGH